MAIGLTLTDKMLSLKVSIVLFRTVLGWCTVDIILLSIVLFRIVFGWCTVDIILLSIVLLGQYLDGAQWISSS